jgi:GNAT superfamily N-acetyltransferase
MDLDIRFRVASLDDAPHIQQLVQSAFRAGDSRPGWAGDASLTQHFVPSVSDKIAAPGRATLVAATSDSPYAASICIAHDQDAAIVRFSLLAVDPQAHRGGLGSRMLTYAEGYAREILGARVIGMNALSARPELVAWYVRRGYERTGKLTPIPHGRYGERPIPEGWTLVEMEKEIA